MLTWSLTRLNTTNYGYDNLSRLLSVTHTKSGTTLDEPPIPSITQAIGDEDPATIRHSKHIRKGN
jgi:YD repeat-containing protein